MSSRLSISLLLCVLSLSLNSCHQAPAYVVSDTPLPQAKMPVLNAHNSLKLGGNETSNVYLQSLDIQVDVTGNIASTRYTMVFKNKTDFVLEGELTFPLPDGRSVTHYALDINGKMRDAVPVEKEKATQTFEEIEKRQVDPGLLERVEGNNFRTRIYPIPANGTRTIQICYEEELPLENNLLYYRLPMDYPNSLEKFAVKATVWKSILKPLVPKSEKEISFDIAGESYVAAFSRENYRPSRSLIFALPVPDDIPQVMMQPVQGSNYFLASVAPKMETRKKQWDKDLAIIWDVSLSGSQRNLQSEIEMLDIIFAENKNTNIHLYFLNNNLKKAAKGNWSEVRKILETAVFDGGTDFSKINQDNIEGNEILFFSDGISTLSDADFIKDGNLNRPMHSIVSSAKADYSAMKLIAGRTNGKFVNLNALSSEKLKNELLYETLQFLGMEHGNFVHEVYPNIATPVQGNFSVAGISISDNAELTLLFGFGGKVEKRVKVVLDAKNAGSQGNTHKIWAQKKIAELDLNYKKNRTELAQLGKQFGVVTRGTSLMVLETIGDYVHFGIEPPASEPELLAEYQRSQTGQRYTEKRLEYNFIKEAVEAAENLKRWRDTDFTLKKAEKRSDNDRGPSDRGMKIEAVDVVGWMDNPSAVFALDQDAGSFANSEEFLASLKRKPTITIKPIKKDNEYLSKLTGNIFNDYQIYLKLRNDYANSPTFYFDVADWFYNLGDKETAIGILTSIAELELENASLYKLLGYKLKEYGELMLQKFIYQKVIQWRPMEPQSYRDYALALADNGEAQAALDSLYSLLAKSYSESIQRSSRGIAEVVVMEMNHLIAKNRLNTSNIDQRLIINIPVDIRLVINWNIDNTDIDVHVEDPSGEECYYGNRNTSNGGRLSADITSGYGPEQFMLKKAIKGKYKLYTNYYGNRQFTPDGPATIMAEIFAKYADKTEQRKIVSFQLSNANEKDKRKVEIAEFDFSEKAVKAEESETSGTFTDSRDGTKYRIAKIGNQVWMAENLKFHASGSVCYNYEFANCEKYGRLYSWYTANNACPAGWHLPNNAEWQTLMDFVGGRKFAGKKFKAKSFGGTDDYGFSALPGGERHFGFKGVFEKVGALGLWWSASEDNASWAYYLGMGNNPPKKGMIYNNAEVNGSRNYKDFSYSVRCLQDGSEAKKPSESQVKKIAIYNERVYLEMEKFTTPFYGISMRFTDKNLNKGSGGYLEVRKVKNGYAIDRKDNIYSTLEGGLESYLKDYLEKMSESFYGNNRDKDAYWPIFVEEGKVQLFIEIIKGFLDDEFLSAPFNEEWG